MMFTVMEHSLMSEMGCPYTLSPKPLHSGTQKGAAVQKLTLTEFQATGMVGTVLSKSGPEVTLGLR